MTEHTILVAVTIEAEDRADALANVVAVLRDVDLTDYASWWVAEDDRTDGSDLDSAVFVAPGQQHDALLTLAQNGHTPWHNVSRVNR